MTTTLNASFKKFTAITVEFFTYLTRHADPVERSEFLDSEAAEFVLDRGFAEYLEQVAVEHVDHPAYQIWRDQCTLGTAMELWNLWRVNHGQQPVMEEEQQEQQEEH